MQEQVGDVSTQKVRSLSQSETERLCEQVLNSHDHYEALMVEPHCTAEAIRKQYKRLALLLHPDKCCIARSSEAFAIISRAFQCLSAPDRRWEYNHGGGEDSRFSPRTCRRFSDGCGDDCDLSRTNVLIVLVPFVLLLLVAWLIQASKQKAYS